jgi:hypothetical protein
MSDFVCLIGILVIVTLSCNKEKKVSFILE